MCNSGLKSVGCNWSKHSSNTLNILIKKYSQDWDTVPTTTVISWTITRINNWESSFKRTKKEKKEAKRCCQGTTYPEYVTGFLKMAARRLSHAPNSWSMTFEANANAAPNFTLRGKNASSSASMKKNPTFAVTEVKCRSYRCSWLKPQTLFKQDLWLEKLNGSQDAPLTNEYRFNNGRMWKSQLVVIPEAHIKKKSSRHIKTSFTCLSCWSVISKMHTSRAVKQPL